MNWWVSWYATDESGPFTLETPWWVSGERGDGAESICAAVRASDREDAVRVILASHDNLPPDLEFRFVNPRPEGWEPFTDRFPRAGWMKW